MSPASDPPAHHHHQEYSSWALVLCKLPLLLTHSRSMPLTSDVRILRTRRIEEHPDAELVFVRQAGVQDRPGKGLGGKCCKLGSASCANDRCKRTQHVCP